MWALTVREQPGNDSGWMQAIPSASTLLARARITQQHLLCPACTLSTLPTPVLCDGITEFLAPVCDFIADHACSFVAKEIRKHIPNSKICDHIHLC